MKMGGKVMAGYKKGGKVKSSRTMSDRDVERLLGESSRTISDADRARVRGGSGRTMSDRDIERLLGESSRTISDADRARARKGFAKGGKVKMAKGGSVDQSMCSPRKQMAMGKRK
jgi:hypothetical protein